MKKKSPPRIIRILARIFDLRSWFDFDRIKSFTLYLMNGFKKMFIPQTGNYGEAFQDAMVRFHITEKELHNKKNALLRLSLLMCGVSICIFGYAIYQMFFGNVKATLVSIVVTFIALALSFRYHFWYFQIKKRKLGCTFHEWYREGLMGDKE